VNGKERVLAALAHREPDRVPVGEFGIDYTIVEQVLGHPSYYRAKGKERQAIWAGKRAEVVQSQQEDLVALVRALDLDILPVFLTYRAGQDYQPARRLDPFTWEDRGGSIWKSTEETGDALCIQPAPVTRADAERMLAEPLQVDESELELVRYVVRELGETHFIVGRGWHSPPSWTDGSFLEPGEGLTMRVDDFLLMLVDDPDLTDLLLRAHTKRAIEYGRELIAAGVDAILINADYCHNKGPWISPGMFQRFVLPRLQEQVAACHEAGVYAIKHTDGLTWKVLDMMVDAGIDGLHGIQPGIGMDTGKLKERYGTRITLFGAVDGDTLIAGTPQDVAREVEYCLRTAAPGGGFVLTSSNSIQAGTPYANYQAMLRSARTLGRYPLSWTT
jgi:uroporphyrinogen decarboxylase